MAKTGPKPIALKDRFWQLVDRSAGPDACWPFKGAKLARGYGKVAAGSGAPRKAPLQAHRVAYCLANDLNPFELDSKVEVRHAICDNPPCCNPAHLLAGTSAENKQDSIRQGRMHFQKSKRDEFGRFTSEPSTPA